MSSFRWSIEAGAGPAREAVIGGAGGRAGDLRALGGLFDGRGDAFGQELARGGHHRRARARLLMGPPLSSYGLVISMMGL